MVVVLVAVLVVLGLIVVGIYVRNARQAAMRRVMDLGMVRAAADEDITAFGDELAVLAAAPAIRMLTAQTQREYESAYEALDAAGAALTKASLPSEIREVTGALERGRYSTQCVRARLSGRALPSRRPPCFFNPQHGPSTQDVDWAPRGKQPCPLPACADDAEHVAVGAEPDIRTVPVGTGTATAPYWRAGSAFAGYVSGYFGSYAVGLLPAPLIAAMQSSDDKRSSALTAGRHDAGMTDVR